MDWHWISPALGDVGWIALAFVLGLAARLVNLPPLVGFFGKYYVLLAAVDAGLVWLAVLGVIASVIGAFYYIRIVYLMYFGAEDNELETGGSRILSAFLVASAVVMVVGVVNLFGVEGVAEVAAQALVD